MAPDWRRADGDQEKGCGDASGALPGQLDEFADEGVDEADELNAEAEEEGLGIGMPVRICNFFASGSDCYNGLIGDVVNVESVPEHAGEEEFLFTVRCLCSVPRRRSFSSVSNVPVSAMAQEAIEANRKQLRSSNHPNEARGTRKCLRKGLERRPASDDHPFSLAQRKAGVPELLDRR
ncbi:Hypothetical protein (Fragment) [Durusdinium trenchii]|uniref:Uncharacterized protein n=1 Tax=Durusdinium trenchii TaxID=1381693 RepID=A0ABP0PQ71_9DINO